jgi:hypothetical protein
MERRPCAELPSELGLNGSIGWPRWEATVPQPDHDEGFAPVERALDRLRSPTTVHDRLGVLKQLVDCWHGPIHPEDGLSEAELAALPPLPLPLRWWYRWAGRRTEVMSGQNFLFEPRHDEEPGYRRLAIEDGHLRFYIENQGVYEWSTLPHGDDPPVFGRDACEGPWERESITLSEHIILVCLFEAMMSNARYGAWTDWLDEQKLAEIATLMPPVALGAWRWMEMRFFVGSGAVMSVTEGFEYNGRNGYPAWLGTKTDQQLQFLRPYLGDDWNYIAAQPVAVPGR